VITQPGEGKVYQAFGNVFLVMLESSQSSGIISVTTEIIPPGGGPPIHFHTKEDEIFLVVDGRLLYCIDGISTEVTAGGLVFLPKGTLHSFCNIGTTPGRHWIITLPGGFEDFLADCSEEYAKIDDPDPNRIEEIHHKHGIALCSTFD